MTENSFFLFLIFIVVDVVYMKCIEIFFFNTLIGICGKEGWRCYFSLTKVHGGSGNLYNKSVTC